MADTKIEWAEKVWNPTVGCEKVSQGCKNCYAEVMAKRLVAMGKLEYQDVITESGRWNGHVKCLPERLDQPTEWMKPKRIFVDSMSDLFHPEVPVEFIRKVWETMRLCQWHTFIILTKRPAIMARVLRVWANEGEPVLPNVWLGVSVEDRKTADERLPWLAMTPAARHIVSYEPALEQIDFSLTKYHPIDWLIMGCESGPKARPMDIEWAKSTLICCENMGTPFFLKQTMVDGKLVKLPELYGKVWNQYPGGES